MPEHKSCLEPCHPAGQATVAFVRIAFFCPPLASHVAVMIAIANELAHRGHACFLVHHPQLAPLTAGTALAMLPLPADGCPWTPADMARHARLRPLPFGVRAIVRDMAAMTESLCQAGPALLRTARIDAVVSDQMEAAGSLVAEHLGLPCVTVASAVPINREPLVPLPVLPFPYQETDEALHRNVVTTRIADWMTAAHDRTIARLAEQLGCAPKQRLHDCLSPLADIVQLPRALDFPRRQASRMHFVGPLRTTQAAAAAPLPPVDPTRPLVFVSLGTLQGHRHGLLRRIALACQHLGVQSLVAHCGGLTPAQAARVPATWVVDRVDQRAAMRRADAVVAHAGLNTALDALAEGVPLLCLPLAFDQPGVAQRVQRAGAGLVLPGSASVTRIGAALRRVLHEPALREGARRLQPEIAAAGGARAAADIVEQVVHAGLEPAVPRIDSPAAEAPSDARAAVSR